jgi:hypothetical protein
MYRNATTLRSDKNTEIGYQIDIIIISIGTQYFVFHFFIQQIPNWKFRAPYSVCIQRHYEQTRFLTGTTYTPS